MTGRILAAMVLAPAPFTLVSPDADRIASTVLLVVVGLLVLGWIVREVIAERRLARECDRPLEAEETMTDVR